MSALITGNTYPVKDQLRALGGTWSKRLGGWLVPEAQADSARALVGAAPERFERRARPVVFRFSSGAEVYRNARGRCEDAPCCGCCS